MAVFGFVVVCVTVGVVFFSDFNEEVPSFGNDPGASVANGIPDRGDDEDEEDEVKDEEEDAETWPNIGAGTDVIGGACADEDADAGAGF